MGGDEEPVAFEADFCADAIIVLAVFVMLLLLLLLLQSLSSGLRFWSREERSGGPVGMVVFDEFVKGRLVVRLARVGGEELVWGECRIWVVGCWPGWEIGR